MIVKFDATTQEVKDASGYAKVTFADNATAEKMKEEARANFCPEKVDQSKCVVTVTENVLEIEVKNEKNIVDVDKTMDAIKAELEAEDGGSFVCDLRENQALFFVPNFYQNNHFLVEWGQSPKLSPHSI